MTPFEMAQQGKALILDAIKELLCAEPSGLSNTDLSKKLGLETGQEGGQSNWLIWSFLAELQERGLVAKQRVGRKVLYRWV